MDQHRAPFAFAPAGVGLLTRIKLRTAWNHLGVVVNESPVRAFATLAFLALIWFALYKLFEGMFTFFQTSLLQSAIAIPLIFNFFFMALLVLLTFSTALLAYGSLFAEEEAAYLLTAPLRPISTVTIKYFESVLFSSWSLLLLGLPLMMAMASVHNESWIFYPMFILFFVAFIPIPGSLGLLLAWAVARFLPRTLRRAVVGGGTMVLVCAIVWGLHSVQNINALADDWLDGFFARMSLVQASILPSTWITRGIEAAIAGKSDDAVRYLTVTLANALFLSWVAVHVVSRRFLIAYDRASVSRGEWLHTAVRASGGIAGRLFIYLPRAARLIAAKDLRTFIRDPMQWSQLAILFGLMALYLVNMPRFDIDDMSSRWTVVVPFLNLSAVSFILATFTSRFVFPMVSLEGQQLWLIGLLPMPRSRILMAKFAFAFTVTMGVAIFVILLASYVLDIGRFQTAVHLAVTGSICYGLCGLAVGIGARMPMFNQRNPARIANGLGGTINLIASVLLIAGMLAGMAYVTWKAGPDGLTGDHLTTNLLIFGAVCLSGVIAGTVAMIAGAYHLKRIEV
ncbi:MAG: hypothetical protein IID39_04510 [Planctomycetes bacterium]|nr:hypothetical protein [Planctomycetota bacterium]